MKQLSLTGVLVVSLFSTICHAQTDTTLTGYNIVLINQSSAFDDFEYKAQQEVHFKNGYQFSTSGINAIHAYVDDNIITEAPYFNLFTDSDFENLELNTDLEVGKVNGSASVSSSGGSSYTIPIKIPKGTMGVEPGISISYNSQSGPGIVGYGWHLSGLSAITRAGKTHYYNGEVSPITLTNEDRFLLDGQYLIPISGENGTNGSEYRTEKESYSKITIGGSLNGGPMNFKVEHKNGLVYHYGSETDARKAANSGVVISWHLKKVEDKRGNYMTYHYDLADGQHRIVKIEYTGNEQQNLETYNRVEFYYIEKKEKNNYYIAQNKLEDRYFLRKISSFTNDLPYRNYFFNYAKDSIKSYLNTVTETTQGKQLNSTIFKYNNLGQPNPSNSQHTMTGLPEDTDFTPPFSNSHTGIDFVNMTYYTGDFNGDGLTDLLGLKFIKHYPDVVSTKYKCESWGIYFNEGNNQYSYQDGILPTPDSDKTRLNGDFQDTKPIFKILIGDLNGDGKDDIILGERGNSISSEVFNSDFYYYNAYFSNSLNNSFYKSDDNYQVKLKHEKINNFSFNDYVHSHQVQLGDFDGDGRKEMIGITTWDMDISINSFDDRVNAFYNYDDPGGNSWIFKPRITTVDYNGDGQDEVIFTTDYCKRKKVLGIFSIHYVNYNNTTSYYFDINLHLSGNLSVTRTEIENDLDYDDYISNITRQYVATDFNGDGNQDIFYHNNWDVGQFWYSKGHKTANFSHNSFSDIFYPTDNHMKNIGKLYYMDINADRKTDIVRLNGIDIIVFINKGNNEFKKYYLTTNPNYNFDDDNVKPNFGDFDGDGKIEVMVNDGDGYPTIFRLDIVKSAKDRMLAQVKDGMGSTTSFSYHTLSEGINYTKQSNATGDIVDVQYPMTVVHQLKIPNGIGGENTMTYEYEGAKLSRKRGFLGFQRTTVTNENTGEKTKKYYAYQSNLHIPYLHKQENYHFDNLTSEVNHRYYIYGLGGIRYSFHSKMDSTINYLQGYNTVKNYTWSSHGNLTYEKTNINGGLELTEGNYSYEQYGSHLKNVILSSNVSRTRSGELPHEVETEFSYYSDGKLKKQIDFVGKPKALTTEYEYDNFGNQFKKTLSSDSLPTKVSTTWYDEQARFVISTTNTLGQSSTYEYHPRYGKPSSMTGINGLTTTYEYDVFGRLEKTIAPNNNITSISREWDIQDLQRFKTTTTQTNSPSTTVWYDALGREIKRKAEGFNQEVWSSISYNQRGKVYTKSLPHFEGDPIQTITNTYDDYGRIHSVDGPTGLSTYSYDYANTELITTVTSPKGLSSFTKDAAGKLIERSDDGGTVSFNYYSHGQQKDVKVNGQEVASMQYDDYARQIALNDANAGNTSYDYDAYGQLISQTDAKNQTTTMEYDVAGRLEKQHSPEQTLIYKYIESGNGIGQLEYIESSSGNNEYYEYDEWDRLRSLTEVVDDENYITTYGYDAQDRLKKTIYPTGFFVTNSYDNKGYLKDVKANGNQLIFTAEEENALGQYTKYQYANGMQVDKTYNTVGMPTHYSCDGIQDMSFDFDIYTGNLNSRSDHLKGLTESFEYDGLQRLIGFNGGQNEFDYFDNGNIKRKTDVSAEDYQYHPTKPHALVGVNDVINPVVSLQEQIIDYNSAQNPISISENGYELTFDYGISQNRVKSILKYQGQVQQTKTYLSTMEIVERNGISENIHYIPAGDGLAAIYVEKTGEEGQYYFVFSDYLGSILTLTDKNGTVVQEQSFDAWGRYRNTEDWTYEDVSPPTLADGDFTWLRGYTGHEYLPQFSLIHMNGRLYDPLVGRMLSPDNFVHTDFGTQGYNRYSYANNNPLKYTDPSGEDPFLIGAAIGIITNGFANEKAGKNFFDGALRAGFAGGVSGVLSNHIGDLGLSVGKSILAHGLSGAYSAGLSGGDIKAAFMSGVVSSAYASALGVDHASKPKDKVLSVITSSYVGGLTSETFDGEFWEGARQGFTSAALNHLGNHLQDNYKAKKAQSGGNYVSGEGNISPSQFRDIYEGKTEGQIMIGESIFLGYKYPNNMADKSTRFVMLANGKEVDMIHFMVVGRAGHSLGFANEFQQFVRGKASGFNPQDLCSNKLGINFFNNYDLKINQSPSQISNYIFQYLTNPNVLYPPPFQPQYEFGPKW